MEKPESLLNLLSQDKSGMQNGWQHLVDNVREGIYAVDLSTNKIIIFNDAFCEMTGYSQQELYAMHIETLHFPEDLEELFRKIKEAKDTGKVIWETRFKRKDGMAISVELRASIVEKMPAPIYLAVISDITEHKHLEDSLRENERFLRTIIETVPECVKLLDLDGTVLKMNPVGLNMLEADAGEVIGKPIYAFVIPEYHQALKDYTEMIIQGGRGILEFEIIGMKGKRLWVETNTALWRNQKNEVTGLLAVTRDITERKQAEDILKGLNIQLTKTNQKFRQLALRDTHTGLYNHRYLTEIIESEFHRAKRTGGLLSVIMLDLDFFKSINDVYGHRFGDMVLKQLAHLLKKAVRKYDIITRFGGEEFVIILPDTDREGAFILAQRILDAITQYNFGTEKESVHLKSSMGVVTYPQDKVISGMGLVNLADQVLGKVKDRGGNNVYSTLDLGMKETPSQVKRYEADNVQLLKGKILKLTKRANQSLMEAIFAFARTIKLKDHYTGEHVEKTVHYAVEMAKALKLSTAEIENIRDAAMLHDLGKIGISEKILLKKSRLSPKEFEEIKKHPQIGADILRPIHFLQSIIPLILYHHERYDGKGYLNGLKGEEIPIGARIIAAADVFQALISHRPYRKAYAKREAIDIVKKGSGTQFDPKVITALLRILKKER
jgi:diguanylate cyclase (GGDEF)-like protein/PAS domain S-box-containing protein